MPGAHDLIGGLIGWAACVVIVLLWRHIDALERIR